MKVSKTYEFTVEQKDSGQRADAYLAQKIEALSRSALTGNDCEIIINGKTAKKSDKVNCNDNITLFFAQEVFDKVEPQDIPLEILYEDASMLVVNKHQGMVVHPGAGNVNGTVVNALAFRYGQTFIDSMADECDVSRPGIVHRLDKDTSGVMVIAKTAQSHCELARQFQNREIKKYYYAICDGVFNCHQGEIECLLARDRNNRKLFEVSKTGGKESRSTYVVIRQYVKAALVKVIIHTGRTHQIRVHMKSINHPVVGDVLYNNRVGRFPGKSLMLHSAFIEIKHPVTGEKMTFEAPLPERFIQMQKELEQ